MKKIVIIGASSGMGQRMAMDFARVGCKVAIAARREGSLREIRDKYPDNVVYKTIDVTAPDAVKRFYDLIGMNDGMDYLVYASGVGFLDPELEDARIEDILNVNCTGMARITSAAYRYYKDTANVIPGHIAVITSVAGVQAIGIAAAYSASKCFQQRYITALDQLAHQQHVNVRFTDIRPGFVKTPFLNDDASYPMMMTLKEVAPMIETAILRGKRVAYIDSRWGVVARLWKAVPTAAWVRIGVVPSSAARLDLPGEVTEKIAQALS